MYWYLCNHCSQQARFLAYNSPKTVWRPGSARTRWGSLSAPPDPLAAKQGAGGLLLRVGEGREGNGIGLDGRGRERRGQERREGKGGRKREGYGRGKREGDAPLTQILGSASASNAGGVGRNRDSEPISGLTACVNAATGRCCKRGRRWTATVSQVMTHRW